MKVSPGFRILEAFARVAVLDVVLVLGLYTVRNRGWISWFLAVVGCCVVFYVNGRTVRSAFKKAYPNQKLPNLLGDD